MLDNAAAALVSSLLFFSFSHVAHVAESMFQSCGEFATWHMLATVAPFAGAWPVQMSAKYRSPSMSI